MSTKTADYPQVNAQENPPPETEHKKEEHANDNDDKSCWANLCGSNWDRVETRMHNGKLTEEEYGERLKASWELVSSLSGFVAGFTYIVSNGVSDYDNDYTYISGTSLERSDIFIILVMMSFVFALTSTLLGVLLIGILNQIGVQCAYKIRQRHSTLAGLPEQTLVLSIFLMLVSALVSIGGSVTTWVWVTCFMIGFIFIVFILYTYYKTLGHHDIMEILDEYDNEMRRK